MSDYEVASRLMDLYCFNREKYRYMFRNKDGEAQYMSVDKPLTVEVLFKHLSGKMTVSVCGGRIDTVFSTFDIDEPGLDKVRLVVNKLAELGVPRDKMYISTSGNKGHHVDIFYDKPIYKSHGAKLFEEMMRDPALADVKVEYFPTHDRCIKIPLGINYKSGRRCWYLDQETLEEIQNNEYVLGIQKWSAEECGRIVYDINKKRKLADIEEAKVNAAERAEKKKEVKERAVMPSYASKDPVLTAQGERHKLMLSKAVYMRCTGSNEDEIYEGIMEWAHRQNPCYIGSSWEEVEKDARGIAKYAVKTNKPSVEWKQRRAIRESAIGEMKRGDIENILMGSTKTTRKVAFLICAYCVCYGECICSYETMAERIGVSLQTVVTAVAELREKKIVTLKKKGGVLRINNKPQFRANRYEFTRVGLMPNPIKTRRTSAVINIKKVEEDFDTEYYKAICRVADISELKKYMTSTEFKICKEVAAS